MLKTKSSLETKLTTLIFFPLFYFLTFRNKFVLPPVEFFQELCNSREYFEHFYETCLNISSNNIELLRSSKEVESYGKRRIYLARIYGIKYIRGWECATPHASGGLIRLQGKSSRPVRCWLRGRCISDSIHAVDIFGQIRS